MPNKTDERIEQAIVNIRKSLMDGTADFARYSRVGAEAIRFQMEELEYDHQRFHPSPPSNGSSSEINAVVHDREDSIFGTGLYVSGHDALSRSS